MAKGGHSMSIMKPEYILRCLVSVAAVALSSVASPSAEPARSGRSDNPVGAFQTVGVMASASSTGSAPRLTLEALPGSSLATSTKTSPQGQQAANLDQIRNGAFDQRIDPPNWVNGNAGASNAHYLEGYSIGYRLVLTNLRSGTHVVQI